MRNVAFNRWSKLAAVAGVGAALAGVGCESTKSFGPEAPDASAPIHEPVTQPEDPDASTSGSNPGTNTDDPGGFLAACTTECDCEFCKRQGKTCGTVTGRDNCNVRRTVQCGTCPTGQTCTSSNVCAPSCTRETDAQFCTRLRGCGVLTAADNCSVVRSVSCGNCGTGMGCCGSQCVSLNASPNCGACGVACDAQHVCSGSVCRLADSQQGCVTPTDCASGVCSRFFTDLDGDGQGDITRPVNQCGSTPGVGLTRSSDDCCDTNPNVFRRNPPPASGQGPWFDVPATTCAAGHLPFDYDCDGRETMEAPTLFTGCGGDINTCGPISGVWSGIVPPCGASGNAIACLFLDDGSGCIPFEQFTKVQRCR